MPKSVSYHEHRIKFLKNPSAAAAFIEAILEEKDPEPELLQAALRNVAEALGKNISEEEAKLHREKIEVLLSSPVNIGIYSLADWLNALGLKLTVTVAEEVLEFRANSTSDLEVTV